MKIIDRDFFERDSVRVAKELLGAIVVRSIDGTRIAGKIVETEAYQFGDEASHCYAKKTQRNQALFGPVGHAYIYQVHTHFCLNIVAHRKDQCAGGVLIRALEPLEGIDFMQEQRGIHKEQALTNGPGKLTRALAITKDVYGIDVTKRGELYVAQDAKQEKFSIVTAKRIGISKAKEKPWRFYIKGNTWVSRK